MASHRLSTSRARRKGVVGSLTGLLPRATSSEPLTNPPHDSTQIAIPPSQPTNGTPTSSDAELIEKAAAAQRSLHEAIEERVVGQELVIELMLVALLTRGHALLVGVPGLAKTLLVASLADALDLSFGRVQFTPDLLPADITGTDVLQEEEDASGNARRRVRFLPGPIFHNLILADEINRTPPKTQAALLQAMQERQVTVGTTTHPLPDPFQVFATRNPIEQEGTYPLPEAQLDRFLLEIHIDYPSEQEEREIARRTTSAHVGTVPRVLLAEDVRALQALVPRIPVTDAAVELAVALGRATRPKDDGAGQRVPAEVKEFVRFGAGPRGSQALVLAAKARAALSGQAAADVDDVRFVVTPVLRHRLVLSYRAEAEGVRDVDVLAKVVASVS
jgi:MoxR-like ATPase